MFRLKVDHVERRALKNDPTRMNSKTVAPIVESERRHMMKYKRRVFCGCDMLRFNDGLRLWEWFT